VASLAASLADRAAVNSMRRKSPDNCKNVLARAEWLDAIFSFSAGADDRFDLCSAV
jgi:hypothetical protein